jgi:hypothetical protein
MQKPSWVKPPSSYKADSTSSLVVAFKDPDGERLKSLLVAWHLYAHGTRATVKKWKQRTQHMSPDLCPKAGEDQYLDHALGVPLKPLKTVSIVATSTTTPPCAPLPSHSRGALTAVATVTALRNALTSSHKHSTRRRTSRRLLSQYLQSLRKACPPLAVTQSAQSSPYLRGRGNLGPN